MKQLNSKQEVVDFLIEKGLNKSELKGLIKYFHDDKFNSILKEGKVLYNSLTEVTKNAIHNKICNTQ